MLRTCTSRTYMRVTCFPCEECEERLVKGGDLVPAIIVPCLPRASVRILSILLGPARFITLVYQGMRHACAGPVDLAAVVCVECTMTRSRLRLFQSFSAALGHNYFPAFPWASVLCADPPIPPPPRKQTMVAPFLPRGRAPQPPYAPRLRDLQGRSDGVPGVLSAGRDGQAVQLGAVSWRRRTSAVAVQGARAGEGQPIPIVLTTCELDERRKGEINVGTSLFFILGRFAFIFLCFCVLVSCFLRLYRFAVRRVVCLYGGTYIGVGTQQQLVNSSLLSKARQSANEFAHSQTVYSENEGPACG